MDSLEKLIKKETSYMFTDVFYSNFTGKILNFVSENKHKEGYVYFIKNGSNSSKVKIGNAIDIDNRVCSYKTAFYEKVFIVGYIKSDNYIFLEKEIHDTLLSKKIKGEWFDLDALDFFNIKENYDFISINDYYSNKTKIKDMTEKESTLKNSNILDFCKKLKTNKKYETSILEKTYKDLYPNENISSTSWFGRELSNTFKILGLNKINSTQGGIRSFTLR